MNWEIKRWFGNSIFITKLNDYEKINKSIISLINKDIKPTNSQFATTTDVRPDIPLQEINDDLHHNPKFKKLFSELKKFIYLYLKQHHYNLDIFDVYITKAWATFSTKGQHISSHKHTSSHFSLVYYVEAEDQGNVMFEPEEALKTGMYIPSTDKYFTKWDNINFASVTYPSETGGLIIFPSHLLHQTQENLKDRPRISISADIILTMKKGIVSEHCLPSPDTWKKI